MAKDTVETDDGVKVNPPVRPDYHQREPQMVPCVIARCCGENGHDHACCIHEEAAVATEHDTPEVVKRILRQKHTAHFGGSGCSLCAVLDAAAYEIVRQAGEIERLTAIEERAKESYIDCDEWMVEGHILFGKEYDERF